MSLLSDLQSLDTSAIVGARANISVTVNGDGLSGVLGGSLPTAALGQLGQALTILDDPARLLGPLTAELQGIAGKLDFADLPIADLVEAVTEAGAIVARLLDGLDERPESWLGLLGLSAEALERGIGGSAADLAQRLQADISPLKGVFATIDGGLPTDPAALGKLIVEFVLPFPADGLAQLRTVVDRIGIDLDGLAMPGARFSGLIAELDRIVLAAEAGRLAEVDARITGAVQAATVGVASVRGDLVRLRAQIAAIDVAGRFAPLAPLVGSFRGGRNELFALLDELRGYMRAGRMQMEALSTESFSEALDVAEAYVLDFVTGTRERLEGLVDAKIAEIADWLRGLFAHLRLRAIRAEITSRLDDVAKEVAGLTPGPLLDEVRKPLADLRDLIAGVDLGDTLQTALADARTAIDGALTPILGALETIADTVNGLAGQASVVLDQAAGVIESFAGAIDTAKQTIEGLGIEQAREQIVATVTSVREAAEEALATLPLPEPLRPVVEQLIAELEKLDRTTLEAQILTPVRDAVDAIRLPPEIAEQVTAALEEMRRVLDNLIPQSLIDGLSADLHGLLDRVRAFDPATLAGTLTDFVDDAAGRIEALDLSAALDAAGSLVDGLLEAVDAVKPSRLLKPVIDAYASAMGALPIPDPDAAAGMSFGFIERSAEAMGQSLVGPVAALTGASPAPAAGGTAAAPPPIDLTQIKPSDALRIFTHIPTKLHEAITSLGDGPAGALIAGIDRTTGGLARDLRGLEDRIAGVERRLDHELAALIRAVQAAEFRARFALGANLQIGPAQVDARLDLLAAADPGDLAHQIAQSVGEVRMLLSDVLGGPAGGGARGLIDTAASALEGCRLAQLSGSLDALVAALDPQPLLDEFDLLVQAALGKVVPLGFEAKARVDGLVALIERTLRDLDPILLARRFLKLVQVIREELDVLNPATLAAELDGIHAVLRGTVTALDPRQLKPDLDALTDEIAGKLRQIDLGAMLGDLSPFGPILDRIKQADPTVVLQGVGQELAALTPRLQALDPAALIDAVNALPDRVIDEFGVAAEAIIDEVLTLLAALKFASGSASVSVQTSTG